MDKYEIALRNLVKAMNPRQTKHKGEPLSFTTSNLNYELNEACKLLNWFEKPKERGKN